MAPVKYKCPTAKSTGCDWEVEHDPRVVSVYIQSHLDDVHMGVTDEESDLDLNLAGVPSKVQEIELIKEDDNRQACKTALMKVECHHFGCDWKLEEWPEVVQIWIQDHMDTEHDGEFPEIELLEEDKNRQACKTALAKVKCQHQGCIWEEELHPEVALLYIQNHMGTEHAWSINGHL